MEAQHHSRVRSAAPATLDWTRLSTHKNPWSAQEENMRSYDKDTNSRELEKLEKEENVLAKNLRTFCTTYGEERKGSLTQSAEILEGIGQVYLEKSFLLTGIKQKLSFIQCAVLLHAAAARFKISGNMKKVEQTKVICKKLGQSLLRIGGSSAEADLSDISNRIFLNIGNHRREIKRILDRELTRKYDKTNSSLKKLEMLAENRNLTLEDADSRFSHLKEEEVGIITKIIELNKETTRLYKEIVVEIAEECLKLLPPLPCKFVIVGLGSLAREEVTLYSDFEHVILLEDGIDQKDNYRNVLEYFRWFSVVFQVIIIGFGETIIPSVTVKSLNDAYSGNNEKNWFYDKFTPRGISFDGMLPHSCNIPLGRQQRTKLRSHTVELIKTPKQMAKYLTRDEHLKNGYYLADVLRQTCLVYGDERTYEAFIKARDCVIQVNKSEIQGHYPETIAENANKYVRQSVFAAAYLTTLDSKSVFYRPLSARIGTLARNHGIRRNSTFAIIEELQKRNLLTALIFHQLSYGFAVACEIRMKSYHRQNQQRHSTSNIKVREMVGEDALQACENMMVYCQQAVDLRVSCPRSEWKEAIKEFNDESSYIRLLVSSLLFDIVNHGYVKEAVKLGEKLESLRSDVPPSYRSAMFMAYCNAGAHYKHLRGKYYPKEERLYNLLKKDPYIIPLNKMDVAFYMAQVHQRQGQKWKCLEVLEEFFTFGRQIKRIDFSFGAVTRACSMYYDEIRDSGLSNEEMDKKVNTVWSKSNILDCQLFERLYSAWKLFNNNNIDSSREELTSISMDVKRSVTKLEAPSILLARVIELQVAMWRLEDALETIKLVQENQYAANINEIVGRHSINPIALKLLCCSRLGTAGAFLHSLNILNYSQQTLLETFASMLWLVIQRPFQTKLPITVLLWVIHLKNERKHHDMFGIHRTLENCLEKFKRMQKMLNQYSTDWSDGAYDVARPAYSAYALLLLAKSL